MTMTIGAKLKRGAFGTSWVQTVLALTLLVGVGQQAGAQGGVNVFTRSYNNQRTGTNVAETTLTQANVNGNSFGKLFSLAVDDQIFAGILYVSSVQIAGGIHNVVYVATVNNSVYAFDADTLGAPLWKKNFNGSGRPTTNADFGTACPGGYFDFRGNIGIVGTPVIDGTAGTIYFVTRTVEASATVQRLRALDIMTGNDRSGSPKVISASVPGTGDGGNTVVFNATNENQRPALGFFQGTVYIGWASYCDIQPYHGWVMAYDGITLSQLGVYNSTPNGGQGGIWMGGGGITFDANGNLYVSTGNGTTDVTQDFSESVVKLAPNKLNRLDYYTSSNYNTLNMADMDFGSGGPTMLPGYNLLVTGGKEGRLYLLNSNNLGGLAAGDTQIPQVFQAVDATVRPTTTHIIFGSNIAWNSPQGLNVFVWGQNDFLHGYRFNSTTQRLNSVPFASGSILPPVGLPGGIMTLSSNASLAGTGILWATTPRNGDANEFTVPGSFYAFNAETLALLWQSTAVGDDSFNMSKGSPPMVANGKVYAASLSRFVSVYGLRTTVPPSQNLALNKPATGSTSCNANETPAMAVNGSYSLGSGDKWCSLVANPYLQVDLGALVSVSRFVIEHAGASGGETFDYNTSAFNIQVSTDGANFTTVVNVAGNIDSITTHDINPTVARYVKLNVITPTQVGDIAARIYEFQVYNQANTPGDYSIGVAPFATSVTAGGAAKFTVAQTAVGNFSGNVTYAVSGLPAGVTASFTPSVIAGSGSAILSIATTASTGAGTYALVVTGTSGTLQHTANVNVTVGASTGGSPVRVNLSPVFNKIGIAADGATFTTGVDGYGFAFSANLLGATQTVGGTPFSLGSAGVPSAVSGATIALPAGNFTSLKMLAIGVNGYQTSQLFTVKYTDGTVSTFTQNLSDWYFANTFPGETIALAMPYRDTFSGAKDNRVFNLYGYSFLLTKAKTVSSVTLPANSNVAVLAITVIP